MFQSRLIIAASLFLLAPLSTLAQSALARGLAAAQRGNCRAAIPLLQQAASQNPPTASLYNALGVCQTLLGNAEQATASLEAVVKLDPQPWQGWNNLGGNYLTLNRSADAAAAFHQAIERNPNAPNAWFNLASALLASAESDPLIQNRAREQAVASSSNQNRAPEQAVASSSNPAPPSTPPRDAHRIEAFYALEKARQLSPSDSQITQAWLQVAGLLAGHAADLIDRQQYQPAFALLSAVESPLRHSASWNNLIGYTEFKLNNPDAAQRHLSSALRLEPDNESYLLDIAEFLSSRQAYPQAAAFLQVGSQRMPDSLPIRFALAVTELLENKRVEATASLENLHSSHPELAYVSHALGEAYEAAENWPAILTLGRALQQSSPGDPTGWYLTGIGLAHTGPGNESSLTEAAQALERAAALNPTSSRYHLQLAKTYESQQDYKRAVTELQNAIRLNPEDERAHYVLAMLYRKTGDTALAAEQFQIHSRIKTKGQQNAYTVMLAGLAARRGAVNSGAPSPAPDADSLPPTRAATAAPRSTQQP